MRTEAAAWRLAAIGIEVYRLRGSAVEMPPPNDAMSALADAPRAIRQGSTLHPDATPAGVAVLLLIDPSAPAAPLLDAIVRAVRMTGCTCAVVGDAGVLDAARAFPGGIVVAFGALAAEQARGMAAATPTCAALPILAPDLSSLARDARGKRDLWRRLRSLLRELAARAG